MAVINKRIPETRKNEGIWKHQFSAHPFEPVLERAEGIYLFDEDGNRYIDASGGPIALNLGHGDPRIAEAAMEQMSKFSYCTPVMSNRPKAELCEKIAGLLPSSLNTLYVVCGGSEAVETAIKAARQYHVITGNPGKHKIISNYDSYHGMTLGTMALSGNPSSQRIFDPMLPQWPKVQQYTAHNIPDGMSEAEWGVSCAENLAKTIHYAGADTVAAYIATPVGSGSDYGVVAPPEYWQAVRKICDENNVLFIDDEVVTGFGRTGKWFCIEHHGIEPDIMTMGKGMSGLYAPMGAMAVSDKINEPFENGATFVHGFTNAGHPVGAAIALKVMEIIEEDGLLENCATVGSYLQEKCDELLDHPTLANVRGTGLLRVAELVQNKDTGEFFGPDTHAETKLQATALANGLSFYSTLYGNRRLPSLRRGLPLFMAPPLCITHEQIDDLVERLDATLTDWEESLGAS
jgi:adenosylmethionine-8-amino-7-oxononanoate aminotransferase